MFCRNCGNQLNGTENVCPQCGTPVVKEEQVQPQAEVNQVASPQPPVGEVAPTPTPAPTQQPVQQTNTNQGGLNKNIIIIVAGVLVFLALIGVIIWLVLGNLTKKAETKPTDGNVVEKEVSQNQNSVVYNGFKFNIPEGYESEENSEYGLLIYDDSIVYTVLIDYTNSYDQYKAELVKIYPDQKDNMELNVGNRKYLGMVYQNETATGYYTQYATAVDNTVFTGIIMKQSQAKPEISDFSNFNEILDNAKKSSSTFSPSESEDAGTEGILDLGKKTPKIDLPKE